MSKQIVLPADVYDTLELVALAHGGIEGRGTTEEETWNYVRNGDGEQYTPLCPHAMAGFACDVTPWTFANPISVALDAVGLHCLDSRITSIGKRIRFADWCRRLNVARGA